MQSGARVKGLAQKREHPDVGVGRRERAARERAAQVREDRMEEALRQLPEAQVSITGSDEVGMQRFTVSGVTNITGIALLVAVNHNL